MVKRLGHTLVAWAVAPLLLAAAAIGVIYYGCLYVVDGNADA